MAGGTTPDAFVPSAYLNGSIVYPGAVSQSSKRILISSMTSVIAVFFIGNYSVMFLLHTLQND